MYLNVKLIYNLCLPRDNLDFVFLQQIFVGESVYGDVYTEPGILACG